MSHADGMAPEPSGDTTPQLPPLQGLRSLGSGVLVRTRRPVGAGERAFAAAADAVREWRMHRGAWVSVETPDGHPAPPAQVGQLVHVGLGPRVLRLGGSCRVLEAGRTDRRAWLTYATEPDHLEDGVERYVVGIDDDGSVWAEIEAWSQPRPAAARHVGPLPWVAPQVITLRYLAALRRVARR